MSVCNNFNVGDKVVYPMHGAGTIDSIDKKNILDEEVEYINISMPGGVKVMVPRNQAAKQGLRNIISQDEVEKVFCILETDETAMSDNWNKRYRDNMDKMKSGDIYEVADVVRNLSFKQKEKGLSTGEKKMLNNAKQILVSELVLVENTTSNEMEQLVDNKIDVSYKENRENVGIEAEINTSSVVSKFIPFNVGSTGTSQE
ncbi:MAG: CarD family transcriptional regulator [Clostridia bacterium]|nr:CarD family transcriptional regulator [Clostridia bacterium]